MADEIQVSASLALNINSNASVPKISRSIPSGQIQPDQTTAAYVANTQTITTAAVNITMGAVTAAGWGIFLNLDATNYVEIGVDNAATFVPTVRLNAGECALFRLSSNTPQGRANTASVKLEYLILSN